MHFSYENQLDILSIVIKDEPAVLQQILINSDNRVLLELDGSGDVCRIQIESPGQPWDFFDLLLHYPGVSMQAGFCLTVISEYKGLFKLLSLKDSFNGI